VKIIAKLKTPVWSPTACASFRSGLGPGVPLNARPIIKTTYGMPRQFRFELQFQGTAPLELRKMNIDKNYWPRIATPCRVLLVAPSPPPYGGMGLQARLLERELGLERNSVVFFPSNFPFPERLSFLNRLHGVRTLVRVIMMYLRLWRQARETEVIHVLAASWFYFFLVVWPAVIVGRVRGKRVVLSYHGGEAARFFRWFGWMARVIFKWADIITAPSAFLAEVIQSRFGTPVLIVPNILDLSKFRHRHRNSLQPKMLVTRHLERIYEVESVLRAFKTVQERYPGASLWVAGTGSEEEHLRRMVSEWNLANVRFLGYIAHGELPAIYDQCDILLNASRVDNFPGALLEGSAAGLVVVSTRAGGIPCIYTHGKNALLVEPGAWAELALAVEKVLDEPSLAQNLTREGAVLARQFEWKNVRRLVYQAYGFVPE
jgi:glycosyltransferase involved in cell wall biosynthesis